MDLTPAYATESNSVKRGIALDKKLQSVIIEDEIENKQPADVYWFAHTKANIQLSKNGKIATLTQNGKKYIATLLFPSDARFTVRPAQPLSTSPDPEENNPNKDIQKLSIHFQNASQARIVVKFQPEKSSAKTLFDKPLKNWK
jgi:hypothetical protein